MIRMASWAYQRKLFAIMLLCSLALSVSAEPQPDGTREHPLRVMLIPADGGTEDGTKADYQPIFGAMSRLTGLHFDIKVGQSYGAVVEGICGQLTDIAFFGPVTYVQAHERGCAQLLGVGVEKGASVYYAGWFAKADSPIASIKDMKGRRAALGDVNSTSSFVFPLAMLIRAGLDPIRDLSEIRLAGSHVNSIAALDQGLVDVAAFSFDSFEKAVRQGAIHPASFKVIARSPAIPYPPLAMNTRLPEALKTRLKDALGAIASAPGITPDMIRGYGGKVVDAYDTHFSENEFNVAALQMGVITDELKGEILRKAAKR